MTIKGIIPLFVFGIAFFVSTSSAQTTVCSSDSVVLVLNGYKQGSTVWQQSSNRTTWSNAQGTSSNDSLAIIATNTYYYRAIVIDGTCSPFYSDTTLVIVNPTPPIAKAATDITQTSFTASWSPVAGATDYFLDVATDAAFTSFVPGYMNLWWSDTTFSVSPLSCYTTYYYRVRDSSDGCPKLSANSNTITVITDSCPVPVSCGNITDFRDGKTYKTIIIGTQCWMAQNLNVGKRIDGIMQQTQYDSLGVNTIEKYCYNDKEDSCTKYGGLYFWDEMMSYGASVSGDKGPKGICPTGWHIPTDNEWTTLEAFLDGAGTAGEKMKDTATHLWKPYNTVTTNSSGFTALPSGLRGYSGSFGSQGYYAYFWTATESNAALAWPRTLSYTTAQSDRVATTKNSNKFSMRCVKD